MTTRDVAHVQRACNKAFAKIAGLFELLEAASTDEQRKHVASVRQHVNDALHEMRRTIDQQFGKGE